VGKIEPRVCIEQLLDWKRDHIKLSGGNRVFIIQKLQRASTPPKPFLVFHLRKLRFSTKRKSRTGEKLSFEKPTARK